MRFFASNKKKEGSIAERSRSGRFALRCSSQRASASERTSKAEASPTGPLPAPAADSAAMGSVVSVKAAAQARHAKSMRVISLADQRGPRPTRFVASTRKLGTGAYGAVLQGTDLCTGEPVAIKMIPEGRMKPASLEREVAMLRRLSEADHPALLHFHAHVRPAEIKAGEVKAKDNATLPLTKPLNQCHALVMEACRGGELFEYVVSRDGLNEGESAPIFAQLVDAVRCAHSLGIAHRDLKLENVLLCGRDGESDAARIKLIDWGLAHQHAFDPDGNVIFEMLHSRCGSRSYMAPEVTNRQISSVRGYDGFQADVWSLGVCLFAIHLGFFPFEQADPESDWRARRVVEAQRRGGSSMATIFGFYPQKPLSLSPALLHLLDHMLVFDPSRRATLADVAAHPWIVNHMPEFHGEQHTIDVPAMIARLRDISETPSRTSNASSRSASTEGATEAAAQAARVRRASVQGATPTHAALLDPRGDLSHSTTGGADVEGGRQALPNRMERQDSASTAVSVGSSVASSVVRSVSRLQALEAAREQNRASRMSAFDGGLPEAPAAAEAVQYAVAGGVAATKRQSGSEQYPRAHSDLSHLSALLNRASLSSRRSGPL